jgi:hypothetical protein
MPQPLYPDLPACERERRALNPGALRAPGWQAESRRFPAGSAFRHSLFPAKAGAAHPALIALQPRIRKGNKRSGNQIVML